MPRSVAGKMGVRSGCRAHFVSAPALVLQGMELPELDISGDLSGGFDYIHLFSITQAGMTEDFPRLKRHLNAGGMLWVSWPKAKKLGSDLALPVVIRIGYDHGLVESTCLRIDDTWAGLKFTHPKAGKVYNNSYGTLPGSR